MLNNIYLEIFCKHFANTILKKVVSRVQDRSLKRYCSKLKIVENQCIRNGHFCGFFTFCSLSTLVCQVSAQILPFIKSLNYKQVQAQQIQDTG